MKYNLNTFFCLPFLCRFEKKMQGQVLATRGKYKNFYCGNCEVVDV